jgi:hypothetical protein
MDDVAKLDHLLECLQELSWVDDHLPQTLGGVHERLAVVREEVRSEILAIVRVATGNGSDLAN